MIYTKQQMSEKVGYVFSSNNISPAPFKVTEGDGYVSAEIIMKDSDYSHFDILMIYKSFSRLFNGDNESVVFMADDNSIVFDLLSTELFTI